MANKITEIPEFSSEEEERQWLDTHGRDLDLSAFPAVDMTFDIEPRRTKDRVITIRMEQDLADQYRQQAAIRNMTPTALMREVLQKWQESLIPQRAGGAATRPKTRGTANAGGKAPRTPK